MVIILVHKLAKDCLSIVICTVIKHQKRIYYAGVTFLSAETCFMNNISVALSNCFGHIYTNFHGLFRKKYNRRQKSETYHHDCILMTVKFEEIQIVWKNLFRKGIGWLKILLNISSHRHFKYFLNSVILHNFKMTEKWVFQQDLIIIWWNWQVEFIHSLKLWSGLRKDLLLIPFKILGLVSNAKIIKQNKLPRLIKGKQY